MPQAINRLVNRLIRAAKKYSGPASITLFLLILILSVGLYRKVNEVSIPSKTDTPKVFTNIISTSGIKLEPDNSSASWYDYDNDGYQDILIVSIGHGVKLYKNNGDEKFTNVTDKAHLPSKDRTASAAAFGDYDNDGCSDLYISSFGTDKLYHNNCNGTFTDVSEKAGIKDNYHGFGVSWVDYNKDGYLDIYVVNHGSGGNPKNGTDPNYQTEPNILYRNNGDGTFTNVTDQAGVAGYAKCPDLENQPSSTNKKWLPFKQSFQSLWADLNNDGWPDVYTTNDAAPDVFYLNNGNGTFTDATFKSNLCRSDGNNAGMGITAGDFDNNGTIDLYLTNSGPNFLYKNDGRAHFTEIARDAGVADRGNGWGTEFFDYNNDGNLDLLVINGTWPDYILEFLKKSKALNNLDIRSVTRIYENQGYGKFIEVSTKLGLSSNVQENKMAGATADFNNDGFVDFYIVGAVHSGTFGGYLYRNTPNGNNWLTIKLVGIKSNRDGIGAKITLRTGGKTQIKEVVSGSSYLGQSSIWQTFGLGKETKAQEIEILWPSGIKQTLKDISTDQKITVTEKP